MSSGDDEVRVEPEAGAVSSSPPAEPELSGCGASLCCDPRRSVHRFVVLPLICFIGFGELAGSPNWLPTVTGEVVVLQRRHEAVTETG